jgi:murein DD-endopeptidase MepM/ murein hydrolase activator NlpD
VRASRYLLIALAACRTAAAPEIRFCPAARVFSYPLDTRRDASSLLLQNIVVANPTAARLHVRALTIELLDNGRSIDQRRLAGAELDALGALGKKYADAGAIAAEPFQFCGRDLVRANEHVGDDVLLVMSQVFAFTGTRDTVRVTVDSDGGPATATLPIRSGSDHAYRFPVRGTWYIGNGPSFHTDHRWGVMEEFAFDLVVLGAGGATHAGDGTRFADYFAYGKDVFAMRDGRVVRAHDGEPEDARAMQQPGESAEQYMARLRADQGARLAKGTDAIAGNYVMIDHGDGELSLYAHLQPGVLVTVGETVSAGQPIGKLGSSGNSTEPHLHFQLCDRPDPLACAGIPIRFEGIDVMWADKPRPLQSGDIVTAN